MIIRKARSKDSRDIAEIYREVYTEKPYNEKWNLAALVKEIRDELKYMDIYVAGIQKKVVGFIIFYDYPWDRGRRGYIEDIGVLKEYRGHGIAGGLFKKAEQVMKKKGVSKVLLDVNLESKALRLYEKIGYKKSGYVQMEKRLK
jgi:ribosomal protein S18 acetylase RimI-like enzyme